MSIYQLASASLRAIVIAATAAAALPAEAGTLRRVDRASAANGGPEP